MKKGIIKKIMSMGLAVAITATSVGFTPPAVEIEMSKDTASTAVKSLDSMATPSEAKLIKATPSQVEVPPVTSSKTTPSQATPSKATSSEANIKKTFVRVEPEKIPEYYNRVSYSGKKFWTFKDRNGSKHYRDYGFIQGDAEFPLWYETNDKGIVDIESSMNLDDEYYELAPYIYKSAEPTKADWTDLLKKLNSEEAIENYNREETKRFKNWDSSTYTIWSIKGLQDIESQDDLGKYFFGRILNERSSMDKWYNADDNGYIWSMEINLMTSLSAVNLSDTQYTVTSWFDIPGQLRTSKGNEKKSSSNYKLDSLYDRGLHIKKDNQEIISFRSDFVGWSNYRSSSDGSISAMSAGSRVLVQGDPADTRQYFSGGTFYPPNYKVDLSNDYNRKFYGIWCPENADMYIFANESYKGSPQSTKYSIRSIIVRRNADININSVTEPTKTGYTFSSWYYNDGDINYIPEDGSLPCGSSGKVTWIYPRFSANKNTVTFLDYKNEPIGEPQIVLSGGTATAPAEIPTKEGYKFVGWDKTFNFITADTVVTAQYKKICKITFHGEGGTIYNQDNYTVETTEGTNIYNLLKDAMENAKKTGYRMQSYWCTGPNGEGNWFSSNTIGEDVDLYPAWKAASVYISLFNNGNFRNTIVKTYGQTLGDLPQLTAEGYKFLGWYTEESGGEKVTSETPVPIENTYYYAHWEKKYIDIIFYDNIPGSTRSYAVHVISKGKFNDIQPDFGTRTGYSLGGWCINPDGKGDSYSSYSNIPDVEKLTLYAVWNGQSRYLHFYRNTYSNDTSTVKNLTTQYGKEVGELPTTTNGDKIFIGWYTERAGGEKVTATTKVENGTDQHWYLYAHWGNSTNTVTYKDWDGITLKTQSIDFGKDATPPETPLRTGYIFAGWDKSSSNIQSNTIITAQYTANNYKLILDGNGGTVDGKTSEEKTGTYQEFFDQVLTDGRDKANRKYYSFAGWYTSPTGGTKYSFSGNKMPAADVTVYAHWTRTSNPVIIKDWNGNIIWTQDVGVGGTVTLPDPPERTGYTFIGWDNDGTNIQGETTITPKYTINSYKLTLDGNGGTVGGKTSEEKTVTYNESFDQILADGRDKANRKYYTFAGWYTSQSGGTKYSYSGNKMPASDVTVYAHWTRTSNPVIIKDWQGNIIWTQDVGVGGMVTLPDPPERTGYTFVGWDNNGTNIQSETTITALYKINHYKLTLNGNGGMVDGKAYKEQSVIYGDSFDSFLTNGNDKVIRQNYSFDGWYSTPTGGKKYVYKGNQMPDRDVTVYAHWRRESYKVTYINWNGTVLDTQQVAAGADATVPTNPQRTGYTFTGWDKPSTNIQGDTTITALYKINHYKLTLDGNGGTVDGSLSKEQSVIYGDVFDYFLTNGNDKIIRQNYNFDGWYSAPTGGTVYSYSGNKMPDTDLTVYAHWIKIKPFIDNQDGTNTRPGADGQFGTDDDEVYANGPDGEPGTADDYKKDDIITPEPAEPEPAKESSEDKEEDVITSPVTSIDSKVKAEVPDNGGTYTVNPDNPYDVTYTKEDGTPGKNEWVGDGEDWYHVNEKSKLDYNWFLDEKGTWYMLNNKPGENFGAALTDWYQESMDDKKYFFDPKTTKMLTGWQSIDDKWYYFTPRNEGQTYFGSNMNGWKYDSSKPGKPFGSMYQNEITPDGYRVDENGIWIKDSGKE